MSSERDASRPTTRPTDAPDAPRLAAASACNRAPETDSQTLLQGHNALLIHHQGEVYRLQHTRLGKLILTK